MERTHVRCYAKGERTRPRVRFPVPPLETSAGGNGFDEGVEPHSRGRLCSPWVEPFSLGNGFRRDAENGNRDGRAPQQSPADWDNLRLISTICFIYNIFTKYVALYVDYC